MKTTILSPLHRAGSSILAQAALIGMLSLPSTAATFKTATEAVSGSYFFRQPIVWVGDQPPLESESQLLWQILDGWRASHFRAGLPDLEIFLKAYTNSPWAPSLHANLGKFYRDRGLISPALEHWEAAWALAAQYPDGHGKMVADYTLAHWTRLLASLGRYETLSAIFDQTQGRVLDRGPLSQMWARTREAFADMTLHPEHSYKCGTFALDHVAQALGLTFDARALVSVPSPTSGFSMKMLADLSTQLGLGLLPVARGTDTRLVVPSVVHWQQEHFAAIVAQTGQYYKVVDPTFGDAVYLTAEVINAEASGFFLVPANQLPVGWRILSAQESSLIYGRGNPNSQGDAHDHACAIPCPPGCPAGGGGGSGGSGGGGGGSGCSSCQQILSGMPAWRVSEPYINLWIEDEPLAYQPALGPRISLLLAYKQRDENTGRMEFFNFGGGWNCSWLSYVETQTPTLSADVQMPGGATSTSIS